MKTKTVAVLSITTALSVFGSPGTQSGYAAHEWGTFTSVQAADGVQMPWNPLTVEELPDFVYSLSWPDGRRPGQQNVFAGKAAFFALQRMETPVIYFYADEPQTVNVSVAFPQGRITEWYPQANAMKRIGPADLNHPTIGGGSITWPNVQILPRDDASAPRQDASGSHYFAARQTEANPLRVLSRNGSETEKFLFYRGVGGFRAPLTVTQQGEDGETLEVRNDGAEALHALFVYQIQNGRAVFAEVPRLAAGEAQTMHLNFSKTALSLSEFHARIAPELRHALVSEGLFEREAAAMLNTWDQSWFTEQGIRVLYILPRAWTDRTLPLAITPAPRDTVRVMLGRAELITPGMESSLLHEMTRYSEGDQASRALAIENMHKLGLGRFTEATMRRVLAHAPKASDLGSHWSQMLQAIRETDAKPAKPLAVN